MNLQGMLGNLETGKVSAYWAGWTGAAAELDRVYGDVDLDVLYLAFADFQYDGERGEIDTSVSGWLTDIPTPGHPI
jgi:hypothetical protein